MQLLELDELKMLVDPELLMRALNIKVFSSNSDEIRGACVIHGGDNRTAFCFRKKVKRFYCYTKKCECDSDGRVDNDVIALVRKVRRCSFHEAVVFLAELTGFELDSRADYQAEYLKLKDRAEKDIFVRNLSNSKELPVLSESLVEEYKLNGCKYFLDGGFSQDIIDRFELGTFVDNFGAVRASIPIRDEKSRLVSISGRRVDGDGEPRYKLLRNFKKRRVLYNLDGALKCKSESNATIIVVEGFKAVWHIYSCGYRNVVAVMGAIVRPEQVNLLIKTGYSNCVLMLDGDTTGVEGMETSSKLLAGKLNLQQAYLPKNKSPDDFDKIELKEFIDIFYSYFK